jgi:hypothetical protein
MSIRLTELLELSHDLCHARKRRSEWEFRADDECRKPKSARHHSCLPHADEARPKSGTGAGFADNSEIEFLRAAIEERGLAPREPLAELVFFRLLRASGPRATCARGAEGTDFDWMGTEGDVELELHATAPAHQKAVETIEEVGSEDNALGGGRLSRALKRLSELLHAAAQPLSTACTGNEDAEQATALFLREEMAHEAMHEAEREELAELAENERAAAEAVMPTPTSPDQNSVVCKDTPCLAPATSVSMAATPLIKGSNHGEALGLLPPSLAI